MAAVACPHCSARIRIGPRFVGRSLTCPSCSRPIPPTPENRGDIPAARPTPSVPEYQSAGPIDSDDDEGRRSRWLLGVLAVSAVGVVALGLVVLVIANRPQSKPVAGAGRTRSAAPVASAPVRPSDPDAEPPRVGQTERGPRSGDLQPDGKAELPPEIQAEPRNHDRDADAPPTKPPTAVIAPGVSGKAEPVANERVKVYPPLEPGRLVFGEYRLCKINGVSVYINRTVFEENDRSGLRPLDCLQDELERLGAVAPNVLPAMRTVKVFVEWDHVEAGIPNSVAVFYGGGGEGLLVKGVLPQKAGQITTCR
jgi:hypothetical protein